MYLVFKILPYIVFIQIDPICFLSFLLTSKQSPIYFISASLCSNEN